MLQHSKLTTMWQLRFISTFDYLMQLNTAAGRSTSDLTQYPVFPWVLSDYTSTELRLDDDEEEDDLEAYGSHGSAPEKVFGERFRDLSKPIGALNPKRLASLLERAEALQLDEEAFLAQDAAQNSLAVHHKRRKPAVQQVVDFGATTIGGMMERIGIAGGDGDDDDSESSDDDMDTAAVATKMPDVTPFFIYGSHYSSIGTVLHFLLRMEPHTSYALQLQGGKYDHADRLFHSIPEAWQNCNNSESDLKELTPEWFYLPDFLVNRNKLELGSRQDGQQLGDVLLPTWAESASDFIQKHRQALESDAVGTRIHQWVDLIFGCKQRGKAAREANNVFFHLTYVVLVVYSLFAFVDSSSMLIQV
jgi:hypothetical protein